MIRSFVIGCAIFAGCAGAKAAVVAFHLDDEIAGTHEYYVNVHAASYQEFTWEEQLKFMCAAGGGVIISWTQGGRNSGWVVDPHGDSSIDYKLDDGAPGTFTFNGLNRGARPYLSSLYAKLLTAKLLILRQPDARESVRFPLSGFKAAAGPKSAFAKQCAATLTPASN